MSRTRRHFSAEQKVQISGGTWEARSQFRSWQYNSRYIVHHELSEAQKEVDVDIVIRQALQKFPGDEPRIISDNGSQFTARDFKHFVRFFGITQVRTSPCFPQSNGKPERWHGALRRHNSATICDGSQLHGSDLPEMLMNPPPWSR